MAAFQATKVPVLAITPGKMASFGPSSVPFANDMDKYLSAHCEPYLGVPGPMCLVDLRHVFAFPLYPEAASPSLPAVQADT